MARSNAATTDEQEPEPRPDAPDPVLVWVKRGGPYRPSYTRPADPQSLVAEKTGRAAVEPVTLQLPPGLGLLPAEHWPRVKAGTRFSARVKLGQIVIVAGDGEPLARGWMRQSAADALAQLEKTGDVPTLELLRDVESRARRPRHDVADAIDDALRRVEHQRAKLQRDRQTQRQQHRRAAW